MGYRSEVAAAFYVTKKENFPALKLWLDENFPIEEFKHEITWFSRGMLLHCHDVKWYDSYAEVVKFDKAVDMFRDVILDDNKLDAGYEFVRIGENYDDIETYEGGAPQCLITVNRSISIDI